MVRKVACPSGYSSPWAALLPLAWKRTGTGDVCLPDYEKDRPPTSKDELGEGESLSMLKNSQGVEGAFAPGGKNEKSL
ncbi:hypothetical protein [Halobacillus kuroshimensis]|uniref:hypothetical protein n=1 Tax=Halobacillus kuroshimensis TaxID=302481 RepID=UPI001A8DD8CA|nr:hypothetical protein [Halobacillus kuroshimensis]